MSATLERLRALRALGAPMRARTVALEPAAQLGGDLVSMLRAALARRTRNQSPVAPHAFPASLPGTEVHPGLRLIESAIDLTALRRSALQRAIFSPKPPCDRSPKRSRAEARSYKDNEAPRDSPLLFLDTETTGLAGGTGTLAFVIAVARRQGDTLHVRQWLLLRPGAERAMLEAFIADVRAGEDVVSYNGRSFDAPLIATRCRLHRLPDPLAGRAHHDLLHAVRRRYRAAWPNCRLVTAERELLGIERHDDLPGSEAPEAWRRFLALGDAHALCRVLDHNRQDLASLALVEEHLRQPAQVPRDDRATVVAFADA